jgi:hypothetical protein
MKLIAPIIPKKQIMLDMTSARLYVFHVFIKAGRSTMTFQKVNAQPTKNITRKMNGMNFMFRRVT